MQKLVLTLFVFLVTVVDFVSRAEEYWSTTNSTMLVNGINSPLAAGAGHVTGGATANLIEGQNFGDAFTSSFKGIEKSMAIGLGVGVATTVGVSYANGINPLTGKAINQPTQSSQTSDFFEGTKYSSKVLGQMNEDSFHGFPESVTAFQRDGYITYIKGGDGLTRTQLNIPGYYGEFQFMKGPDGIINHRFFQPYR